MERSSPLTFPERLSSAWLLCHSAASSRKVGAALRAWTPDAGSPPRETSRRISWAHRRASARSKSGETPKRDDALLPVAVSPTAEGPGLRSGTRHTKLRTLFLCVAMLVLRLVCLDAFDKAGGQLALRHFCFPLCPCRYPHGCLVAHLLSHAGAFLGTT